MSSQRAPQGWIVWACGLIATGSAWAQFQEVRVTTDPGTQAQPAVSGTRIVWRDSRNGNYDIYLYDIATAAERAICTMPQAQWYPDIDGSRIVWQDNRFGSAFKQTNDVFTYNLATSSESPVTTAGGFQMYPAISGTRVVWHDTRGTNPPNVYMYDLAAPGEVVIWQDPGAQYSPDISGDRIVCLDDRTGYRNVRLYDLATQTERAVTDTTGYKESVRLCGDLVVWDENRNGNWDIYLYDLSTETETRITSHASEQKTPAVSQAAIVWVDYRNDPDGDIYLYDLTTGHTVPLVTEEHAQTDPDIDGYRVVWTDERHGNADVFYLDYERPTGADLEVSLTDQPDPVAVGDHLIYQLVVRNNGPETAEGVAGFVRLSDAVEFVSAHGTRGLCHFVVLEDYPTVICPMGDLEPGWVGEVTVVVRPLRTGRISARGSADAGTDDPIAVNNMATVFTRVVEFLKKDLGDGWWPRIEADATGAAHICFTRDGLRQIEHFSPDPWVSYPLVHCWDDIIYATNRSGRWQRDIVFDGTGHPDPMMIGNPHYYYEQALYSDIALDAEGFAHIVYVVDDVELDVRGVTFDQTHRLEYIHNRAGAWSKPVVVAEQVIWETGTTYHDAGVWSVDLEVDADAHAHVIYMNCWGMADPSPLVYCTNTSGSWQRRVLTTAYDRAALALDSQDHAHVTFYTWDLIPGGPVEYQGIAYMTNAPDGVWQDAEAVETFWSGGQMEGMVCDIVVDSLGRPHISYVSGQGQPREDYRHAVRIDGSWQGDLVEEGEFTSGANHIAIAPGDVPVIAYNSLDEEGFGLAIGEAGDRSFEYLTVRAGAFHELDVAADIAGGVHAVHEREEKITYFTRRGSDEDHDGIPDALEAGPDGSDPSYDGNGDGIPDSQQDNVTSFHTNNDYAYVTVACPNDVMLGNVGVQDNPSPPDVPDDWNFVFDFIGFTVMGLPIGGSTTVTLDLPPGSTPDVYYKYGPTHAQPAPHWYPFMYDGQTGAEIFDRRIVLHFVDGQRGDNDLWSNGIIVDPGAPGWYEPCLVDLDDLLWLVDEWMMQPPSPELTADLDGDGTVNVADFAHLAAYWLQPCPADWPK